MSFPLSLRSAFPCTFAFACTLLAFVSRPVLGAQAGAAQQESQAPTPTEAVPAPLNHYNHFDLEPGADFDSALQAIRALKERQAREWAWAKPPHDGEGGVEPFQIIPGNPDRWGIPGAYGSPEIITWSLAPDTALYFPTVPNQLFGWMNGQFGSTVWISQIEAGFQRWSEMTGIHFVRVQFQGNEWDDGADYGLPGVSGLRGDIRVFAAALDGPGNTLAVAEPPAGIPPGPSPGEITFDFESWATTLWNPQYGFERAIHHEIGHAIGLDHTCPAQSNTKLMQPASTTQFGTPQHDDARGGQALYGDPLEPNDTREQASFFQIYPLFPPNVPHVPAHWPPPASQVFPGGILSIDNFSDHDWFEFGLVTGLTMTIKARPIGGTYQDWPVNPDTLQCPGTGGSVNSAAVTPLNLQIWRSIDANDDVLLAQTSASGGATAQLTNVLLKYPGRYRIHVYGTTTTVPKQSQQYELEVTWSGAPCPNNGYCSDGISQNGTETCAPQGACLFAYIDDDYNFDSIPDSMEPWLGDCDSNGRVDVGETAYLSGGQPRAKVRGQDACGDAQPIAAGVDYHYMTYYATPDPATGTPSSGEPGVWFGYTPQTNGVVSVQVRSHMQVPMELALLIPTGGGCGGTTTFTGSQIEWSPFGQPLNQLAELTFEGLANVEHRIRVSGDWAYPFPAGDFILRVEGPDDVTNDCDKNGTIDVCQSAPDCNGNGIIDSCELVGATNHCLLSENRSGPGSIISAAGSLSVSANNLTLVAEGANPNTLGIFIASTTRLPTPEEGKICLAGPVIRLGSVNAGPDGVAVLPLDLTQYPQMSAGSTWNFQFWFRDNGGPGIGYVGANVSDAIELKFCP